MSQEEIDQLTAALSEIRLQVAAAWIVAHLNQCETEVLDRVRDARAATRSNRTSAMDSRC